MSKIAKLYRDPRGFFRDAVRNRTRARRASRKGSGAKAAGGSLKALAATVDLKAVAVACARLEPHVRYVYLPWIEAHGDALFEALNAQEDLCRPLPLIRCAADANRRRSASRAVRARPDVYRRLCLKAFSHLPPSVTGVLFSLDWNPVMRQAAYACKELGLEAVLIPHEAMFANEDDYYKDVSNGADYPVCDRILTWGPLQTKLFVNRGYPRARIVETGAPKFDRYRDALPVFSRELFCRLYRFQPERPIVLFALQPLDSQYDPDEAREAQLSAVLALLGLCQERGWQLLLRGAPNQDEVIKPLRAAVALGQGVAVDEAELYLSSPEESIRHAALVCSVNSTMLFEAALAGRPSLAARFLPFDAPWERFGGPVACDAGELRRLAPALVESGEATLEQGPESAFAQALSPGSFDGQSARRVVAELMRPRGELYQPGDYSFLFAERCGQGSEPAPGTVGYYTELPETMNYVPAMLGFRGFVVAKNYHVASRVDVFARWSGGESKSQQTLERKANEFGRPRLILEDGFIRSIGLGLSGAPGLSISIDDKGSYYDATRRTRLEDHLNGDWELSPEQRERCQNIIASIAAHRLSKYNHAPDRALKLGDGAVLVVDQRYGDKSIELGLASASTFDAMLEAAAEENPGHAIVVKRHPDAITGGKESSISKAALGKLQRGRSVHLVESDINPHALLDRCAKVYTVSSGLGFEALMRGLEVHCFGMPYYAGWGATVDAVMLERRQRRRSMLEIFHAAYLVHSRYYDPDAGRVCELEDLIAYLARVLGASR